VNDVIRVDTGIEKLLFTEIRLEVPSSTLKSASEEGMDMILCFEGLREFPEWYNVFAIVFGADNCRNPVVQQSKHKNGRIVRRMRSLLPTKVVGMVIFSWLIHQLIGQSLWLQYL
jgi:hypothetical protein